jgi:tetratricopeptide (TPR) repeat protein
VYFEYRMGDYGKARQRYAHLLEITPSDSLPHAAALGGYAMATSRLAREGLAERSEAIRLLRQALAAQKLLELNDYHQGDIGTEPAKRALALLLGPTPEGRELVNVANPHPLAIEFLLQGDSTDRARALDLARALTQQTTDWAYMLARAHAELTVGSHDEGVLWGRRAIERSESYRGRETDEELRIANASVYDTAYKAFANDLLGNAHRRDDDVALAFHVTEQMRARVLLGSLVARASGPREPIPEAKEILAALRPEEALVSFMVWAPSPLTLVPYTRGLSWAFILTRDTLRVLPLPPGSELEPAVKAWVGLLDSRRPGTPPGSRKLYSEILEPILKVLPQEIRSLILVPDGPLHRLPFDALSETGGPPFLVDRYALSIVPSATIWLRLRQRVPRPAGIALAFANTPDGPALRVAETRGEIEPGLLAPLLHSREEAEEAVEAFPHGSRLFAGSDARPEKLSGPEFGHASLVHFAAHGVVNRQEPRKSFLLLAPSATGSGRLMVSDIQKFDWTGKTVVLAACETSVGAFRLGEGVLSVARGFFAGGASSVLGTLAQVRDDEQRALFHAFYGELRHGVSVGDAMTAAKRALIRSGAPPAAWANVIVLGDATVRPRAPDPAWPRWAVLGGSLAGLAVLAIGLRARRRNRTTTASA